AVIGGGCGLVLAFAGARLLARSAAFHAFTIHGPLLNAKVLLFALALSLATALVSGIVPALRVARAQVSGAGLQESMRRDVRDRVQRHLVSVEVAFSVILLVGAGLLTRSMLHLQREPLGFNPHSMRVVNAKPPSDREPLAFYDALLGRLQAISGVDAIAVSSDLPLAGEKTQGGIIIEGRPVTDEKSWVPAGWQLVNDDYFRAMEVPIRRGRPFRSDDREGAGVAIVSDALARRYWPHGDALGRQIAVPGFDSDSYEHYQKGTIDWITIVGISGDVRPRGPAADPIPEIYLPYYQHPAATAGMTLAVRSSLAAASLDRMVASGAGEIAPEVPVRIRSYEELLEKQLSAPRLRSQLIVLLALLAVVLAAGGIYGVTANWVEQRKREIGIRVAHGAQGPDVLILFIRRALGSTLVGIVLGLGASIWLVHPLTPFLFHVQPRDPLTFAGAVLLAVATTIIATYIPARRASRVNPVETLRYE
ncbi:MAG: permease, partial [Acidobacteria bacterium]|nr:permease [Acidobacteriota bacterium]